MAAELTHEVAWDGQALLVEAATDHGKVTCKVPRETVHSLRIYSDAIGREIQLERYQIVEKLAPYLLAKLSGADAGAMLELHPWEVHD
ncbi:hypothetical protein [Bradyrhizobium sp. WD16]|uniref:hypothetical protein n=1 Tax=Bradyrhizobium sp. WD16 TaxID=1521768 RepID=UPI0020A35471|nr:hypothetical protein [Bradyrhizobium sp. WD16]UTD27972.1 hypothetical protein DB459_14705 [Bradyrhizobium sp. WD16]